MCGALRRKAPAGSAMSYCRQEGAPECPHNVTPPGGLAVRRPGVGAPRSDRPLPAAREGEGAAGVESRRGSRPRSVCGGGSAASPPAATFLLMEGGKGGGTMRRQRGPGRVGTARPRGGPGEAEVPSGTVCGRREAEAGGQGSSRPRSACCPQGLHLSQPS